MMEMTSITSFVQTISMMLIVIFSMQVLTLARVFQIPMKLYSSSGSSRYSVVGNFSIEEGNLAGKPGQGYYIEMLLGTPPQKLDVLVDTGSSNFAVAAAPHPDILKYFNSDLSSTFSSLDKEVYVPYTQGDWKGELAQDTVRIATLADVNVTAIIACIKSSQNFFINGSLWEGILGLAYADIARPDSSITPFFDSLVSETAVDNIFSMQLCGTMDNGGEIDVGMGGTLIVGGIDSTRYTGEIQYAKVHKEWYYEIVMVDLKIDHISLGMDCKEYNFDKTIVDSGTTNLRLPKAVFEKVRAAVQRGTVFQGDNQPPLEFWRGEDVLCWPEGLIPWELFPPITITLAKSDNSTFDIIITGQQYLRAVGDQYDPTENDDCFKFAIAPSDSGTVLGAVVMEGFYVIFDRENQRVGFAETTCPNRTPSSERYRSLRAVSQSYYWNNTSSCWYVKPADNSSTLLIVAYVMAGVSTACLLPLVAMIIHYQLMECRRRYFRPGIQRDENPLFSDEELIAPH